MLFYEFYASSNVDSCCFCESCTMSPSEAALQSICAICPHLTKKEGSPEKPKSPMIPYLMIVIFPRSGTGFILPWQAPMKPMSQHTMMKIPQIQPMTGISEAKPNSKITRY